MIPQRILLIRPDHLGDVILSLPVAEQVRKNFAQCRISYLVSPGQSGLKSMVGYVDEWLVDRDMGGRKLGTLGLIRLMRNGNFDHLIELKPAWRTAQAGFLSGIPVRIGTRRRLYSVFYNRRINLHRHESGKHQTDLDLALLAPFGLHISGAMPSIAVSDGCKKRGRELVDAGANSYIIMHPGSGGSAPNWPEDNYRALAGIIQERTGLRVAVTGQEKISEFEGCIDLIGKTTLEELAGVISGAMLFISGSTGPLHLADALGVRCISFFLNRDDIGPIRWGPRRNMDNIMTPPNGPCRCANLSACRCLEKISPQVVFEKVMTVSKMEKADTKS